VTAGRRVPALERAGRFFFAHRNAVFPVVVLGLVLGLPPGRLHASARADAWVDAAGIAVALLGQALRAAVIGLAYIQRGGRHGRVYAARLVTDGMFRHCRNPLYVGNLLVVLGLFVVHGNLLAALPGLLFFAFAYRAIVAAEETYLRERFGRDYDRYCARVNRWVPDLRGLRRSLAGMTFDWRKVIAKEYGTTAVWTATLLLLLAEETVRLDGAAGHHARLVTLASLLALVLAGWLAARYWKKTRPATRIAEASSAASGAP
jgi:protein-S-isoprenylcysteine O-methyltransferase Ste14